MRLKLIHGANIWFISHNMQPKYTHRTQKNTEYKTHMRNT